ncbi:MAG: fused MFS/spermidine synthase [Akkermansiaceae bacterium]
MDENRNGRVSGISASLGLVFFSGFAALIYQVLWMKQNGLLFGNSSQAAGVTLASFFAGLAVGSWFFGRKVSRAVNPMRTYFWLEIGIAITALFYFLVLVVFEIIYPPIFQAIGSGFVLLLVKFLLSLCLVFPPAFFMGGTIPVLGQFMIRDRAIFGKTAALMYGFNTLGAAGGAMLAGFYLPLWLGFNLTCVFAIIVSLGIAGIAWILSRNEMPAVSFETESSSSPSELTENQEVPMNRQERRRIEREQKRGKKPVAEESVPEMAVSESGGGKLILIMVFLSGFGVLALEVLWTRMFSQVFENSVYTFAAILVILLLSLAVGAVLSSQISKLKIQSNLVLAVLMILGAAAVVLTPSMFLFLTDGMQIVTSKGSWTAYMFLIFKTVTLVVAPSAVLLGTIFPYLMKLEERFLKTPGQSLGRLAAGNTVGAVLGALVCGFFLLEWLGIWVSLWSIALLYLVSALLLPLRWDWKGMAVKVVCSVVLILNLTAMANRDLPIVSVDPLAAQEEVIETWEGSDCMVAVTEGQKGLAIKINSHYSLGSTGAFMQEKFQADLPLMIYPESESVFFLGIGTGSTAGGALSRQHENIKRVVACELVPEVITAAKKYMTDVRGFDTTGGLFKDPRAKVIVEDGRHYLMATDETFDMINSDLFVPFRSGAGSLYTKDHFENAKKRLLPGGVFVQWLPLYQLTENEFSIIAKTMVETFDQVSMWRHNFQPGDEVVALIGHQRGHQLPASDIDSIRDKLFAVSGKNEFDLTRLNLPLDPQTILLFYGGNLTAARSLFNEYPINTDNRPVIEYVAPRTYRKSTAEKPSWFVGERFADFVDKVHERCPPENDPLLVNRTAPNRRLPLAGQAFHRARIAEVNRDAEAMRKEWEEFVAEWTNQ